MFGWNVLTGYLLWPSSFSIRVGCGLNTSSISLALLSFTESPPPFSAVLSMSRPLSSLVLVRLMLGPASWREGSGVNTAEVSFSRSDDWWQSSVLADTNHLFTNKIKGCFKSVFSFSIYSWQTMGRQVQSKKQSFALLYLKVSKWNTQSEHIQNMPGCCGQKHCYSGRSLHYLLLHCRSPPCVSSHAVVWQQHIQIHLIAADGTWRWMIMMMTVHGGAGYTWS